MSALPRLIIQPRRLGDLVLTFPLMLDLARAAPNDPIWVAGERTFFEPLLAFAPNATFFPTQQLPQLGQREYAAIYNFGSGAAAAECAANARAPIKLGQVLTNGQLHIKGFWQLYRESLTHNNYHNRFHWADLYRLDTDWPLPETSLRMPKPAGSGRIGLFIGASESTKRPQAPFWAQLANQLAKSGLKPILLGGQAEASAGAKIMGMKAAAANFCGRTSLPQLAAILKTLDLLITPDTGPMHLADWLGVPVLNLSMGNVSAFETGPRSAGQRVVMAGISCYGCWRCLHKTPLCHDQFKAARIASIAASLARGQEPAPQPGLVLATVTRDSSNLYQLTGAANSLDAFWQAAFLLFAGKDPAAGQNFGAIAGRLAETNQALAAHMRSNFATMLATVARAAKKRELLPDSFWHRQPRHSRLFAGNLQMTLQNAGPGTAAFTEALSRIDIVQAALGAA